MSGHMHLTICAPEYQKDGSFLPAAYAFDGSTEQGWTLLREGKPWLNLGPGYRLLRARACGVCSTDLDRRFLPFRLPQIIGHEVLAADEQGNRCVIEINASHAARGAAGNCPFCTAGLDRHCPDRLVLGIHDLPGGFGPHVLAPVGAVLPVPAAVPDRSAVLIEPLAAALHAVTTIAPRQGDRIAVLGTRRLGLLAVAALAAYRADRGLDFEIIALARRRPLLDLAAGLGADTRIEVAGDGEDLPAEWADVVIDTTGTPAGLAAALRSAKREVHLKSTHGRPAAGLGHLTELVVDELNIARFDETGTGAPLRLARGDAAADALRRLERQSAEGEIPRAGSVVVDSEKGIDAAIRPLPDREVSLVRPGGWILIDPGARGGPLVDAVARRGLRLTSSRCGDFRPAIRLLETDPRLRHIGDRMITHVFPADRLAEAFTMARHPDCIKAVVEQGREG